MQTKSIIIGIIALIVLVILIQNSETAIVQILFWSISMPLLVLILATAFLGFALGYLICSMQTRSRRSNKPQI